MAMKSVITGLVTASLIGTIGLVNAQNSVETTTSTTTTTTAAPADANMSQPANPSVTGSATVNTPAGSATTSTTTSAPAMPADASAPAPQPDRN